MKKFIACMQIIVCTIPLLFSAHTVFAINPRIEYKLEKSIKENFKDTIALSGLNSSGSYGFYIPQNSQILQDGIINLKIKKNITGEVNSATLGVSINGSVVKDIDLEDENNIELNIELCKEVLVSGYNNIKFKSSIKLKEEVSEPSYEDVSVSISNLSYIEIQYEDAEEQLGLSEYPYPYIKLGYDDEINSLIVLNDNASELELSAALNICQDYSRMSLKNTSVIEIKYFKDLNEADKEKNIIYIGDISYTPSIIHNLLEGNTIIQLEDKAFACEYKSPFNINKNLLFIGSKDIKLLDIATRNLSDKQIARKINKNGSFFSSGEEIKDNGSKFKQISLESLGYTDTFMYPNKNKSYSCLINLGQGYKLKSNSYMNLELDKSPFINAENLRFNAYINHIFVGEYGFSENENKYKISIPKELKDLSHINFKIDFKGQDIKSISNMEEVEKTQENTEKKYISLSKATFIELGEDIESTRNLARYDKFLVKDGSIRNLSIVTPDILNNEDLNLISKLIFYLSKDIYKIEKIDIIKGIDFMEGNKNYIFLGTPRRNSGFRKINSELFVNYEKKFKKFKANAIIKVEKEELSTLGAAEILKSPWYGENSILSVTSPREEGINQLLEVLCNEKDMKEIKGNLLLNHYNGDVTSNYVDGSKIISPSDDNDIYDNVGLKGEMSTKKLLIAAGFIILTTVICIIVMLLKRKRIQKKQPKI